MHDLGDGLQTLSFQESAMVSLNDVDCHFTVTYLKENTAVSQKPSITGESWPQRRHQNMLHVNLCGQ